MYIYCMYSRTEGVGALGLQLPTQLPVTGSNHLPLVQHLPKDAQNLSKDVQHLPRGIQTLPDERGNQLSLPGHLPSEERPHLTPVGGRGQLPVGQGYKGRVHPADPRQDLVHDGQDRVANDGYTINIKVSKKNTMQEEDEDDFWMD